MSIRERKEREKKKTKVELTVALAFSSLSYSLLLTYSPPFFGISSDHRQQREEYAVRSTAEQRKERESEEKSVPS